MQATMQAAPTDALLTALVEAKGNPKLAIDLLERQGVSLSSSQLVEQIKDCLPDLKQRMEVVAQLELFSLMPLLRKTLVENLTQLEPGESVTAYMKLMELITKSVGTTDINLNINDQRFAQLPRNVAQALALVEASEQVIEHQPDSGPSTHRGAPVTGPGFTGLQPVYPVEPSRVAI